MTPNSLFLSLRRQGPLGPHSLGLSHNAVLKNLAVRAPVARAVNLRGAGLVALRHRRAFDAGPEPPGYTTHAPARQDTNERSKRQRA